MPTRKRHLNRVEQAQYLAALQELRVAGFDLDVPYQWQESRFLDIQVAEGPASTAFRMPNFGIGYAIYVRMVATGARLSLLHCQVRTAWDDQIALLNVEERDKIVRFGWLKFSRNEILNQKFDSSLHFHYRGQMVEGMILAVGCQAIPATYGKRAQIPFLLTVTDSLGREVNVK